MEINKKNINDIFNNLDNFDESEVHLVNLDCITDAGINPREVDIKYAEQIPLSAPPIILGIIKNDQDLKDELIIIDGNHRMYSHLNVHGVQKCFALIKIYDDRGKAIIDAYKYNINHGKRLSDREIATGIKKTVTFLKMTDNSTFDALADMLNMSRTSMSEYVMWDKVERVIGENIDKIKATKLYTMLKDKDNGVNNLKKFYKLNKNLSARKTKDAIKLFKQTGKIVDYEQYLIKLSLDDQDEIDDHLENDIKIKPKSITLVDNHLEINDNNSEFLHKEITKTHSDFIDKETKNNNDIKNYYTEKEIKHDVHINEEDLESTEVKENLIQSNKPSTKEEYRGYTYSVGSPNVDGEIIEGQYKNTTETIDNRKDDLISVKGLTRKYSFETVLGNIFNDLQEDVLNSKSLFEETLNNHLHENRDKFESKKEEYLGVIKNCQEVLIKMARLVERANKDLKQ